MSGTLRVPLRERKEDIPDLVDNFVQRIRSDHKRFVNGLNKDTIETLIEYHYPGNVRELQGILRNAFLTCKKDFIEKEDLEIPESTETVSLRERLADCALSVIKERLQNNNCNVKC